MCTSQKYDATIMSEYWSSPDENKRQYLFLRHNHNKKAFIKVTK